jgi:HEAT repeat protein
MSFVFRIVAVVVLLAGVTGAGAWYYVKGRSAAHTASLAEAPRPKNEWVDQLYSSNPTDAEAAVKQVEQLGPDALPVIHQILQDPNATPGRVKGALKACAVLGPIAAPAIGEVVEQLPDPTLTADAAMALSFMGPHAFPPLRDSLSSDDAVVRREALRSIGKLKDRAPLDATAVVPLLIDATQDTDPGVRAVAATYLGIIHEGGTDAVFALMDGLKDEFPDVRRAAATALGSFGSEAEPALPALRKASGDLDQDVAREAGVALVKLSAQ